jgi:PAS domain S-box-containing protein
VSKKPSYEALRQRVRELEAGAAEHKRDQEALRDSEERYRAMVEGFDGLIYICSKDYRVEFMNKRFIERTGYDPTGELCYKALHDFESICPWCVYERVIKGETVRWEVQSPKDNRWYYVVNTPIFNADGSVSKQALILDITDRKRNEETLRESEQRYSNVVENSLTGIYVDQDEKIVFANHQFAEIYGYTREELIGMDSWRLVHEEDRPLTNERRALRLEGKDVPAQYRARGLKKSGETIWVTRRNIRIDYCGRPAILGNVVDITKQVNTEQELRKINEELKSFIHVVSHDLKTPIISIQGFSNKLLRKYQGELGEEGRKVVETIKTSAARMEALVSDLLELSRVGRITPDFQDVFSVEIIHNVISELAERFKDKRPQINVRDNMPRVHGDPERIYQVFENLLVNAMKFMGDADPPTIDIGYQDKGAFHQFYVRDNGIGIDPEYHKKIFEMFHRLKEVEDRQGTGLGLAIVDRIVCNHGGRVWVESEKGKGATFYFTLMKTPIAASPF